MSQTRGGYNVRPEDDLVVEREASREMRRTGSKRMGSTRIVSVSMVCKGVVYKVVYEKCTKRRTK